MVSSYTVLGSKVVHNSTCSDFAELTQQSLPYLWERALNKPLSHLVLFAVLLVLGACTPLGNFEFTADPLARSALQGETFPVQITVQRTDGYKSPITISLISPSGIKVLAPSETIPPGSSAATLKVSVDPSAPATDELKLTLRAVGDRRQKSKTLALRVLEANFEPLVNPSSKEVQQGQVFLLTVGLRRFGSFDQAVKVSLEAPAGSGISASEATIGIGETSTTLTVVIDPNAPLVNQTVKLRYIGGGREKTVDYVLKVTEPDF